MKTPAPSLVSKSRRGVGFVPGISFMVLAGINLSRWSHLEGWYHWATISAFLGGLLLTADESLSLKLPHCRLVIHVLLAFGVLLPLDALAFFTVMRIAMDGTDYLTFCPPPILLSLWWILLFAKK